MEPNAVTTRSPASQPAHLSVVMVVAAGWLLAGSVAWLRRLGADGSSSTVGTPLGGRAGRGLGVAAVGAFAALATGTGILAIPGPSPVVWQKVYQQEVNRGAACVGLVDASGDRRVDATAGFRCCTSPG